MFLNKMKWALLWALLIFILCTIPGHDIPHISFLELLRFDKFVHASIFFLLYLLTARGFYLQSRFSFLNNYYRATAALLCVVYGGSLEIIQGLWCIGRTADVYDFIANSIGVLFAVLFYRKAEMLFLNKFLN
jgi:VanZ family protein